MANYWRKRSYQESATTPDGLAKRGLVYLMAEFFAIPATSSVNFAMLTNGADIEFEFYDIISDLSSVQAVLIEAPASVTTYGTAITPRNLNRQYADAATASIASASAVSGGTPIASELVGTGGKAGGALAQDKIHTLRNNTTYVMSFYNTGNQTTNCHMNLGWSEREPDHFRILDPVDPTD